MTATTLLVTCHPSPASLCAHIAALVEEELRPRRTRVIVDDLHALGFNPLIGPQEMAEYYDDKVPADIAALVEHLRAVEELVFVLPVWMYGLPALLKGYFDRVWRPHVSFAIDGGAIRPLLPGIGHLTAIVCHGATEAVCDEVGDGTRLFFATSLPSALPGLQTNTRFDLYGLDSAGADAIRRELDRITRHFAR
jgi:putative NADPH-quinone reductase